MTKKLAVSLLIGILILTVGCANTAEAPSPAPESISEQPQTEAPEPENMRRGAGNAQARPSDFRRENNQNEIFGKITAISENAITLAIGSMDRPEGAIEDRGAPPAGNGSRVEGARLRPERGGSSQQVERPANGARGGPDGAFSGDFADLEYSGEEISYTLSEEVAITRGVGENSETLTISDLTEGAVIRLLTDESGQPASVQVLASGEADE